MNLEKVVFGFFVVLAATLNFGFFIGDLGDPELHSVYELFAAVVVNLIATVLKFGDRTQIGAVHLATSLVASLQLITAAVVQAGDAAIGAHRREARMTVAPTLAGVIHVITAIAMYFPFPLGGTPAALEEGGGALEAIVVQARARRRHLRRRLDRAEHRRRPPTGARVRPWPHRRHRGL